MKNAREILFVASFIQTSLIILSKFRSSINVLSPQIISLAVDNSWGESSVEKSVAVFLSSEVVKTLRCASIYMHSPSEFDLTLRTLPQPKLEGSRCLEQQATRQLQRCFTLLPHPTSCRFCECRQVYSGYSKSSEVPQNVPRFLG
jgi:hypothetical protein